MPLLLTPAEPLLTTAQLPAPQLYAIIEQIRYTRRGLQPKTIVFEASYYASETASVTDGVVPVQVVSLPTTFSQPATPEQANAVPMFEFLEQILTQQLTQVLGEGATIENVP